MPSVLAQVRSSFMYVVICILVGYIVIDKSQYTQKASMAVVEQPCQCPSVGDTPDRLPAVNTGDRLPAVNQLPAVNSGDRLPAVNTGDRLPAVNSGDRLPAVNTGDRLPAVNQVPAINTGDRLPAVNTADGDTPNKVETPRPKPTTTTTTTTTTTPAPPRTTSTAKPAAKVPKVAARDVCDTCNVFDVSQENGFDFPCVQMKFYPPAPVCLYPVKQDIYVSGSLARSGTWEAGMVQTFQKWLRLYPGSGVIDVGANLGVYSLVAAAMGRNVVSVEPNIENLRRYHKAIKQGKLDDRIVLLQNAISDNAGVAKIMYNGYNQGDTRMQKQAGAKLNSTVYDNEQVYTKMIVMDDLTPFCNFTDGIMKIDIQGFEHRAFVHAAVLFDKVKIHKVMMEWDMMKPIYQKKGLHPDEYELVEKMIDFFMDRNYTVMDWEGRLLHRKSWNMWPFDIVWHRH